MLNQFSNNKKAYLTQLSIVKKILFDFVLFHSKNAVIQSFGNHPGWDMISGSEPSRLPGSTGQVAGHNGVGWSGPPWDKGL